MFDLSNILASIFIPTPNNVPINIDLPTTPNTIIAQVEKTGINTGNVAEINNVTNNIQQMNMQQPGNIPMDLSNVKQEAQANLDNRQEEIANKIPDDNTAAESATQPPESTYEQTERKEATQQGEMPTFEPVLPNTPTDVRIYDQQWQQISSEKYAVGLDARVGEPLSESKPVSITTDNTPPSDINQVVRPNVSTVPEVTINIPEVAEKITAIQQSQSTEKNPHTSSQEGSEAKQYLKTAKDQTNDKYESARQSVINEKNAIITESPTEAEKLKQLAEDNPDMLKSALNIEQAVTDISDWTEGFLDPQLQFTKASEGVVGLEGIRKTEIDKETVSKVNQAILARNKDLAELLRDYDPTNDTGDTVKKLTDLNKEYKRKVSNIWMNQAKIAAATSQSSNQPLTVSQKFKNAFGVSPEYAANAAESGHMRALAKGVRKMSFFQGASVVLSAAGIAADVYEHREDLEYALITKNESLIKNLKDLKRNVSKDTWNTIVEDTIDSALLTVDVIAGTALTPLGGAALGVFVIHPAGALLKSLYYKKEYPECDFGKTFLENLKLGNHDHFVLKSFEDIGADDYLNNDGTLTLYGSIEETDWYDFAQDNNTLRAYAQKIVLEGYINDLLLLGEVDETILHGKISYNDNDIDIVQPIKPNPNKNNESLVIYGDDYYNEVENPPPIMFPDRDIGQCQSAQGCISEEEEAPSLDPESEVGIVSPTIPFVLIPAANLASGANIVEPPTNWSLDKSKPIACISVLENEPVLNEVDVVTHKDVTKNENVDLSPNEAVDNITTTAAPVIPAVLIPVANLASEANIVETPTNGSFFDTPELCTIINEQSLGYENINSFSSSTQNLAQKATIVQSTKQNGYIVPKTSSITKPYSMF